MMLFVPDIVVEVTRACDRLCRGCYAPNLLVRSQTDVHNLAKKYDSAFIEPDVLNKILNEISRNEVIKNIAIRGGEPTLHPQISKIITYLSEFSKTRYLETHGRWLENSSPAFRENLLQAIQISKTVIKFSYDKMHQISSQKIAEFINIAEKRKIKWVLAITEESEASGMFVRNTIPWVPDNLIFFQYKVTQASDLIQPRLGTITSEGGFQVRPTNRFGDLKEIKRL